MIDREKVIKGLECCTQHGSMCGLDCDGYWSWTDESHTDMERFEYRTKCSYGDCKTGCVKTLAKDALALLKAQEPVEPKMMEFADEGMTWEKYEVPTCGVCGALLGDALFCPMCGKAVKRND